MERLVKCGKTEFMKLEPSKDSKAWLSQKGKLAAAEAIDHGRDIVRGQLQNCNNNPLSIKDIISYMDFAVKAGDIDLYKLVKKRAYPEILLIDINMPGLLRSFDVEILRNITVSMRSKAMQERKEGKIGESEMDMILAERYYEQYEQYRLREQAGKPHIGGNTEKEVEK